MVHFKDLFTMPSADISHVGKDAPYVQHSCKNSGNRVPVTEPTCQSQIFCQDVKIEVLHSIDTTRKGQNLSASFPCNKNTLTFSASVADTRAVHLQKDCSIPLQPLAVFTTTP